MEPFYPARPVRAPVVSSGTPRAGQRRRGKNASPAADRWPTFTFPARGRRRRRVGSLRRVFISCADRAASRARRRHHRCPWAAHRCAMQACRAGGACASATQCAAGNRVERGCRGEFCPRVRVVASYHRQLAPRDGCRSESAATRRASTGHERKPISGVQRRRRPVRQACMAINAPRCATQIRWKLELTISIWKALRRSARRTSRMAARPTERGR